MNNTIIQKIKESKRVFYTTLIAGVSIALIIVSISVWYGLSNRDSAQNASVASAGFTSYQGGQVSLDIAYYDDNGEEVSDILALPGQELTVRYKYANTGQLQAANTSITSTLPTGFSYVAGTLRNVFNETVSVPLQNSLFTGQSLAVSPTAGLYTFPTNAISGVLDMGKADYIRVQKCSVVDGENEVFIAGVSDVSQTTGNPIGNTCSSNVTGGFVSGFSIPLLNQRYLKRVSCNRSGGTTETFAQFASNTAASSSSDATGTICGTSVGGTFNSVQDIDLLSGRYARILKCDHPTTEDEFAIASALNTTTLGTNDATGDVCASIYTGSSFISGYDIDLYDPAQGDGFIEFRVTTPVTTGCKTLTATMTSTSFSSVSATSTCGIRIQNTSVFGSGIVTLSKAYFNGVNSVNTLTLPIGGSVKVRLSYQNTASIAAQDISITDSFDTTVFEYVTGSARVCYADLSACTDLSDNLFTSGSITVAPEAGIAGNATTAQSSSIEQGRERYLHLIQCFNGSYYDTFVAESDNVSTAVVGGCSDYGLTGYTKQSTYTIDTTAKRYLNMLVCEKDDYYDIFVAGASNTSGGSTANCEDFGLIGYTTMPAFSVDLHNSSNLNIRRCGKAGVIDTYISEASTVSGASTSNCYDQTTTGYSGVGGFGINSVDTQRGYGYIEYQLNLRPEITSGVYGSNASLNQSVTTTGDPVNTVTAEANSTITVLLYCDSVNPVSKSRSNTLSDAELRTDQDFTCNYDAQICPVVFEDSNLSGLYEQNENRYDAVTVELRRFSDSTLVDSYVTDVLAPEPQCFTNLASGEVYNVVIPVPPSTFSTTLGDTVTLEASLLTSSQTVLFGYATGGIVISSTPEVFFPTTSVSNSDTSVTTTIPTVSVRDLRTGVLPWTVTGVVSDFVGATSSIALPVADRFTTEPLQITTTSGQANITKGSQYTVTGVTDPADIFGTGAADGGGEYSIGVDVTYSVPAYTAIDAYQSILTFTLL